MRIRPTLPCLSLACAGLSPSVLVDDVNAAPNAGTPTCNLSSAAWTDNVLAVCPLVAPGSGDGHLNTGVTNPCVDAGLASSPAGVAPTNDLDGDARGGAVDIGADESQ